MKTYALEKKYQFRMINGRLEIEVIHVKPVFGNVEFFRVCLVVN